MKDTTNQNVQSNEKELEKEVSILGERMRALREKLDMSYSQVGKAIGKSKAAVVGYEMGYRYPKMKEVNILAKVLHTSTSYLTGETDHPAPPLTHKEATSLAELIKHNDFHYDGIPLTNEDLERIIEKLQGVLNTDIDTNTKNNRKNSTKKP
ncbi:transcriptional regulator with XRE-family HTH domain [Priestia megaterium]|uniref:helix-turn-helix domain-containing protein n=1 Tax=Priestia megaterium TaxID=1404 RepID=UPI00339262FB